MRVVFVNTNNSDLRYSGWLTHNKEYIVISIYGLKNGIDYRIIGDDRITPALHPANKFKVISPIIPNNWVFKTYPDYEWELTPFCWAGDGFWTAYFDGDLSARSIFEKELSSLDVNS